MRVELWKRFIPYALDNFLPNCRYDLFTKEELLRLVDHGIPANTNIKGCLAHAIRLGVLTEVRGLWRWWQWPRGDRIVNQHQLCTVQCFDSAHLDAHAHILSTCPSWFCTLKADSDKAERTATVWQGQPYTVPCRLPSVCPCKEFEERVDRYALQASQQRNVGWLMPNFLVQVRKGALFGASATCWKKKASSSFCKAEGSKL